MSTDAIEKMLSYPAPLKRQEMVYMNFEGGAVVTSQNTSGFTHNLLKKVDERIEELVHYAQGLANYYRAIRELRQSTHTGTEDEKFDPLNLMISDARPEQCVVRLRWSETYPARNKSAGKTGLNWLVRDQGMQYSEAKLLRKSKPYMRDIVKEVEFFATVLRIEIKATTRLRRSLVGFDREYLPVVQKATAKLVDYCGGLVDLKPYLPTGPVPRGKPRITRKKKAAAEASK